MRRTSTALILTFLLLAAACSSSTPSAGPGSTVPSPDTLPAKLRIDIDPRSYFDEYPEVVYDQDGASSVGVAAPNASTNSTNPSEPFPEPPPVPGINDDNTFDPTVPGQFVSSANDPRSTFGLDVDTGSYNVGRTFLATAQLPPAASVRVEEWVNAFDYGYPNPSDEDGGDIAINIDGAPAPFTEDGTQLLRIGLQGRSVSDAERPDANLTFVIDVSGSMDIRERLGLVKASLALLVLNLRDTDTLSIVTYSDDASVLLEPTRVSNARKIVDAIDELVPNNSTNMEAGLREGYRQAQSSFRPDAINTVVLASDGVANAGATSKGALADLIRQEGLDGVRLVTIGFGMGNYNDALMETLADRGDGFYSYIDTFDEAERLFTKEITSTLTAIAKDAKIQVTFDPSTVAAYRLVGYQNRAIADDDFENDSVDAGELGAGHTVTALYELQMAPGSEEGTIGKVALRYKSTASDEVVSAERSIDLEQFAPSYRQAPSSLQLAGLVATFAGLLRDDPLVADRQITTAAVAELTNTLDRSAGSDSGRATAADLSELIEQARLLDS